MKNTKQQAKNIIKRWDKDQTTGEETSYSIILDMVELIREIAEK